MIDPDHPAVLTARLAKALGLSHETVARVMQGQDALTRLQATVSRLEASERTLQASEARTLATVLGTHPVTSKETPNE